MSEQPVQDLAEEDLFYPGSKRKRQEPLPYDFIPDPWEGNFFIKKVGGREVKFYAIGSLADALGVSTPAVRAWIRKGYIPQSPYRLPANMVVHGEKVQGRRLYTKEYIDAAVEVFRSNGVLGQTRIMWAKHPDISIEVLEAWKKIEESRQERGN